MGRPWDPLHSVSVWEAKLFKLFRAHRNARSRGNRIVSRCSRGDQPQPPVCAPAGLSVGGRGADQMQQVSSLLANQLVRSERRQLAGPPPIRTGPLVSVWDSDLGTDAGRGPAVLLRLPAVLSMIPALGLRDGPAANGPLRRQRRVLSSPPSSY